MPRYTQQAFGGFAIVILISSVALAQIAPIVIRAAKDHPECQIYLKADGSRLLFHGKVVAAGGKCPPEFLRGTVTCFGATTYRLWVPDADCIITPEGWGQCHPVQSPQ